MSWFSSGLSGIKTGLTGIGHAVGSVASNPWVKGLTAAGLAATGVGAPLAAGIMATEGAAGGLLRPGGNIGQGLQQGALGAVEGYGAGKIGGALRGGGLFGKAGALMGIKSALPGASGGVAASGYGGGPSLDANGTPTGDGGYGPTLDANGMPVDAGSGDGQSYGSDGAGGGGFLSGVKSALGGIGGLAGSALHGGIGGISGRDLALGGLAAYQIKAGADASAKQSDLVNKSLDLANSNWAAGAGLRSGALARLTNPVAPVDLSSVYRNPANPFARSAAPSVPGSLTPSLQRLP
jgi:hypothetical protein